MGGRTTEEAEAVLIEELSRKIDGIGRGGRRRGCGRRKGGSRKAVQQRERSSAQEPSREEGNKSS